jgi:uncharacterized NAD(P)/FAD-binding protein YdhS
VWLQALNYGGREGMARKKSVAIVGGGPTAVYTLRNLLQKADHLNITIFEAGPIAGCGIPYSEDYNSPDMMANITSVEVPPVMTSLADWVRSADNATLKRFDIVREKVADRDYYPRILLGQYYNDQLERLIAARAPWHDVTIATRTHVQDIKPGRKGFSVTAEHANTTAVHEFDAVVMATGHLTGQVKSRPTAGLYRSPYPEKNLALADDRAGLILGSSLSAIDAVVALALRHGAFSGSEPDLTYKTHDEKPLRLFMASRKGVVPDADFFYPIPEEPLLIFTPSQLEQVRGKGQAGLLSKAFRLFKQQLVADDADFVTSLSLPRFTLEGFSNTYFEMRKQRQGFKAMADDLAEARSGYLNRRVLMWRYTMMRAHEVFGTIVPFLNDRDLKRFAHYLAPVFADAYGCIPHLSIARLLALHRAGCLDVVALGEDGTIRYGAGRFVLDVDGQTQTFKTMIDARGQNPATISELGFHKLHEALATRDLLKRSHGQSEDHQFRLRLNGQSAADIFCISIPVMMERYPFAQGLVACSEAAEIVAAAL